MLHHQSNARELASTIRASQPAQLELALATAEEGFQVFPVGLVDGKKKPLTLHGFKDATTDLATIIQWWNRWPHALVSIPTGNQTGLAVLDIDTGGETAFGQLMVRMGLENEDDLSRAWASTPSGGRHYYFRMETGTTPRTRASDIAANIDSRGIGGSIIIPGNVLPDGRSYRWRSTGRLHDSELMPRELLYLMMFGARERQMIKETPKLVEAMRYAAPAQWAEELQSWRDAERARINCRLPAGDDFDGMRRQAVSDLQAAVGEYAALDDGRRNKLFTLGCRVARYVAHGVLTELELRAGFMDAARANGALVKHGVPWAITTIHNAIKAAQSDPLPPLAREFRTGVRA